ncbi:hypothetical protein O181_012455 [Austropuccinia psidii MF-1]|uniref:DUF7872 domain-containing protein n=1 Tax=Austropuccinia psidii MF-1 TaxID=1389203 RepID=A0A9Q3BY09_9BASI|nr:hypothetical protein [Austropuccinia psidii MF-1]
MRWDDTNIFFSTAIKNILIINLATFSLAVSTAGLAVPTSGQTNLTISYLSEIVNCSNPSLRLLKKHPKKLLSSRKNKHLKDPCLHRRLKPQLWEELNLDQYLLDYPGGQYISLEQLAINSRLLNFDCGIEKLCYAGQLCSPVKGKDWYILVAAQEWNSYMNILYQAVGFSMTMMQGIIPSMIKDFFPDEHDDWAIAKAYLTFTSNCAKVHPTEGHKSYTKWLMQLVQGQIGLAAGEANIMDYAIVPDPVNQHDKWTFFISQLSQNQDMIQTKLAKISEDIISSGISTQDGVYGILKDGKFLVDHLNSKSLINLASKAQSEMKLSIELNLLAAIWKKQAYNELPEGLVVKLEFRLAHFIINISLAIAPRIAFQLFQEFFQVVGIH